MKRTHVAVLGVAAVLTGMLGPAAVAASPEPTPTRPVYLALGDSIATGQNSEPPTDSANANAYWRTIAAYKRAGYVTPFSTFLKGQLNCLPETASADGSCGRLQVVSLARSAIPTFGTVAGKDGVTTSSLIAEQLEPAVTLISERRTDGNPRNDVEVITLTVGGNEIFDAFRTGDQAAIGAAIATFAANYGQILGTLRAAAGPSAEILTMTYFNPLRYCSPLPLPEGVTREEVAMQADFILEALPIPLGDLGTASGFNGIIEKISAAFGAVPAETFGALGEGDFFDCKHPDASGYAKILTAFESAWSTAN